MAIRRKTYKGNYTDENEVFVCDTASDLSLLPSDAPQGSSAFVIEDSTTHMIDSYGVWTEVQMGNSGGDVVLENLSVDANGTYTPQSGRAYKKVTVNVGGPAPDPTDGKTHIWITIDDDTPADRLTFPLYWRQSVSNGVSVNWGDDSASETFSGTGAAEHEHTYAEPGDYEIVLSVTSGVLTLDGTEGTSGYSLFGSKANTASYNRQRIRRFAAANNVAVGSYAAQYCHGLSRATLPATISPIGGHLFEDCYSLSSVEIPSGVTSIGEYAFSGCYGLDSAELPDAVSSIGSYAFRNCVSLRSINLPSGITAIQAGTFQGCCGITGIHIPSGVTSIGNEAFSGCSGLTTVTVPASVTSIGYSTFLNCYGVSEYHIKSTVPPTLSGPNAFTGMPSGCVIYVPASTNHTVLNAYKTATNWSAYAGRMREEG